MTDTLTIVKNTYLKSHPESSAALKKDGKPNQLVLVKAGTKLDCVDIEHWRGKGGYSKGLEAPHYWVQLDKPYKRTQGIRWFVFAPHAKEQHPDIKDKPISINDDRKKDAAKAVRAMSNKAITDTKSKAAEKDLGPLIKLPGSAYARGRRLYEPLFWVGGKPCPFVWAEVLNNDPGRRPREVWEIQNIMKVAKFMTKVRATFAQPIIVTSWHRPEPFNSRVGGSTKSFHRLGKAIDFRLVKDGLTYEVWKKMCDIHRTDGLAIGNGFIHLDLNRGYPASWSYGGAPTWRRLYM